MIKLYVPHDSSVPSPGWKIRALEGYRVETSAGVVIDDQEFAYVPEGVSLSSASNTTAIVEAHVA